MAGAIVSFDYATWTARYPEFGTVGQALVTLYFNEATIQHANDGSGPVEDPAAQAVLLNMLTAHIAALNATLNGQPASPLVGRINSATEGSVTVAAELPTIQASSAWYLQTKYGLAYWNATAPYRTMRYRPGRRRVFDPFPLFNFR